MATRKLEVQIVGDDRSLQRALGRSEKRMGRFSQAAKRAAAGLAVGAGGVAAFAIKEAQEAEKAGKQTAAVIKSTGGAANVTRKQVEALAESISMKAGIDDEAIQSAENLLLTFTKVRNETGKGNDVFNRATQVVTDMSVALGQDMKSSSIQVGKALNDPIKGITALRRVGVSFTQQQQDQIKAMVESGDTLGAQKKILRELTVEFGGSAAAQATALDKAKVAVANLAESIGVGLAPTVNKAATAVSTFVTQIRTGEGAGGQFRTVLTGLAASAGAALTSLAPLAGSLLRIASGAAQALAAFAQTRVGIITLTALAGGLAGRLAFLAGAWAVARITAFVTGIKAAIVALRGLSVATASTGIGAIAVVIGTVAGALLGMSSSSARASTSARDLTEAFRNQADAMREVRDIDIDVAQRKANVRSANVALASAEQRVAALRRQGKTGTLEYRQAEADLAQAKVTQRRATRDLGDAEADSKRKRQQASEATRDATRASRGRIATLKGEIAQIVNQIAFHNGGARAAERLRAKQAELRREIARLKSKSIKVNVGIKISDSAQGKDFGFGGSGDRSLTDRVKGSVGAHITKNADRFAGFAGAPGGGSSTLRKYKAISSGMGLSAGRGPGQGFRRGDPGWHGKNRAFDSSGPPGAMMRFAKTMFSRYGSSLLELIYTPLGRAIKNGRSVAPYAQADHFDHVHVAAQRGGLIPGAGDGDKVRVLAEPGEGFINKRAVRALGGSRAINAINAAVPRFAKGGVIGRLVGYAKGAGFKGRAAAIAAAVAMAESGGRASAHGDKSLGGSYGLWQIHHPSHPEYPISKLYNPNYNARAAYRISGGGRNWGPWTQFRTGAYRRFLPDAMDALGSNPTTKAERKRAAANRKTRGASGLSHDDRMALADLAITRAEGTTRKGDDRNALIAKGYLLGDRNNRIRGRLRKIGRSLRGKLTKSTRSRLLAERTQLIQELGSNTSERTQLGQQYAETFAPVDSVDIGGEGGGPDTAQQLIAAQAAATEAVKEYTAELKRQNDYTESVAGVHAREALKFMVDVMNGGVAAQYSQRRATAGDGSLARF